MKVVLSEVYPDDYPHSWKELKISPTVHKMSSETVSVQSDNSYLVALAEADKNVNS